MPSSTAAFFEKIKRHLSGDGTGVSVGALALLLIQFSLLVFGSHSLSFTIDEPSHLAAGYAYLARGALWTIPERGHPLLVDAWEALPFYVSHPDIPLETLPGWESDYHTFVAAFAAALSPQRQQAEFVARVPAMLLATLLAAIVYRWACTLWGKSAGLVALGIATFDPALLAHGRLVTNDVGVTALGTLSLYALWRWSRKPTWPRMSIAACFFGLTLLAKGSGVLWMGFGAGSAVVMSRLAHHRAQRPWPQKDVWLHLALLCAIPGLILWAGHGFTIGYMPGYESVPVPAPHYWAGVLFQAEHADKPVTYALGRWRETGWPGYFPLAFAIKNPLPLLLAFMSGCTIFIVKIKRHLRARFPVAFALFYTGVAMLMGPNIGFRHLLPVAPVVYLLAALGIWTVWQAQPVPMRNGLRGLILALKLWYIVGTLRVYPYNLAYFNELTGGPDQGWRYLEGSNTDWGQGWVALRAFETEHGIVPAYSGWEGYADAAPKDLWEQALPPARNSAALFAPALYPAPGDYVLSANSLSGAHLSDPDNYAWFRYHTPDAVLAASLLYYHVEADTAPVWLAQCNLPTLPLDEEAIASGFGELELRKLDFDCTRTWIYPQAGTSRGVYALHAATLTPPGLREQLALEPSRPADRFAARHVTAAQPSYRQWENRWWPAFALYESTGEAPIPKLVPGAASVAHAETPPEALDDGLRTELPLHFRETFAWMGLRTYDEDGVLEIESWWRVTGAPSGRPCSVMAHLVNAGGGPLGVDDGLGILPTFLENDDIVVQRHRFPKPAEEALWLRVGVYYLDTMERIPLSAGSSGEDAIFIRLPVSDQKEGD